MAKRKALGRGLGAFFPNMEDQEKSEIETYPYIQEIEKINAVLHVSVLSIRPNPDQPRRDFDEIKLQELSDSIRMHGLIQPITVRPLSGGRYELISGERRLRASKMGGLDTIPAYIREVTDSERIAFALIENVQRENLNSIEIALGYQQLIEECGLTQEEVAKKVGKNRTTVTNMLRLLNLPASIQSALKLGKISTGHARSLLSIVDEEIQEQILAKIIEQDLSVRQIEDLVRKLLEKSKDKKKSAKSFSAKDQIEIHLNDLSKQLRSKFSTKVQIKQKNEGGEIRIEYYSNEDLERLLSLFETI